MHVMAETHTSTADHKVINGALVDIAYHLDGASEGVLVAIELLNKDEYDLPMGTDWLIAAIDKEIFKATKAFEALRAELTGVRPQETLSVEG